MPTPGKGFEEADLAEAAAWIARLHADTSAPADEAAFRAWLASDPAHQTAFAAVTETWDAVGGLRDVPRIRDDAPAVRLVRRRVLTGGLAAVVAVVAAGIWQRANAGLYETGLGEQRRVGLDDGSELLLDTDTRVRVRLDEHLRELSLERGRVNCKVVADAARPFVVAAGRDEIVTDGTTIDVRRDLEQVSVVCLQGDAVVQTGAAAQQRLSAGQRLAISPSRQVVDRPALAPLVAWHSGQATFDNESLVDAVREMNRYSRTKLVAEDPRLAALRVSGTYHVGDNAAFAQSVTSLLPVRILRRDGDLLLVPDSPQKTSQAG